MTLRARAAPLLGGAAALAGILLLLSLPAEADDYWVTAPPGYHVMPYPDRQASLLVINQEPVPQVVQIEGALGPIASATIPPNAAQAFNIEAELKGTQKSSHRSYHITAPGRITVDYLLPNDPTIPHPDAGSMRLREGAALGTDHIAIGLPRPPNLRPEDAHAFIAAIATQDNTRITIQPMAPTRAQQPTVPGVSIPAIAAGASYTTTLNRYEAINIESDGDLTGTRITADAPIAAFSGALLWEDPYHTQGSLDPVFEQLPPLPLFGRLFAACASNLIHDELGDLLYVVSATPGTTTVEARGGWTGTITLNGVGAAQRIPFTTDVALEASQPVLVAQVNAAERLSDRRPASMVLLNPIEAWTTATRLVAPSSWTNAVTVASTQPSATLDGLGLARWRQVAGTTVHCAHATVSPGLHTVTAPAGVFATITGDDSNGSGLGGKGYWHAGIDDCLREAVAPPSGPTLTIAMLATAPIQANLQWTTSSNGGCPFARFLVYERTPSTTYGAPQWTLPGTRDGLRVTKDRGCEIYHYMVRAETRAGLSPPSNEVTFDTGTLPWAPNRPQGTGSRSVGSLSWLAPLWEGCPILAYHVAIQYPDGRTVQLTKQALEASVGGLDACTLYEFQVTAENRVGRGPPASGTFATTGCPVEGAPVVGDADGDGQPDSQDPCPADAANGCVPPPADPARRCENPRPTHVVATRRPDGSVEITWRSEAPCEDAWWLLWNGTQGPVGAEPWDRDGAFSAYFPTAWHGEHLYHVQGVPATANWLFDPATAVTSNLVPSWCPGCPPDDPAPRGNPSVEATPEAHPTPETARPPDATPGKPTLWLAGLLVALLASAWAWRRFAR